MIRTIGLYANVHVEGVELPKASPAPADRRDSVPPPAGNRYQRRRAAAAQRASR